MMRKFSVATALAVVLAFQSASAVDGGSAARSAGAGAAQKAAPSGHEASAGRMMASPKVSRPSASGSETHYRPAASGASEKADEKRAKGFRVSVEGELDFNVVKFTNKDAYQIARGVNTIPTLYAYMRPTATPITPMDGIAFTPQEVATYLSRGADYAFARLVDYAPNSTTAANDQIVRAIGRAIPAADTPGLAFVYGDAGVLGEYDDEDRFHLGVGASVNLQFESHINDDMYYGGHVHLAADSLTRSAGGMRSLRNKGAAVFFSSKSAGMIQLGTDISASELMRVDASSLTTKDGGIDGEWFRFANIEGYFSGGRMPTTSGPPAVTTGGMRSVDVRRPFYVLPRLYTSYMRVADATWFVEGGRPTEPSEAPKISFYSARYSGVQLGVSYTPDEGRNVNPFTVTAARLNRADYENVFSGGLSFEGDYQGFKVRVAAIAEAGKHEDENFNDLKGWSVGGHLTYAGAQIAGSYANLGKSGLMKTGIMDYDLTVARPAPMVLTSGDTTYWTIGGAYSVGAAMFSVSYFESTTRPYVDTSEYENKLSTLAVGIQYDPAFGTGKKSKLLPYVSWVKFTPKEAYYEEEQNNSGSVWLAGVSFTF